MGIRGLIRIRDTRVEYSAYDVSDYIVPFLKRGLKRYGIKNQKVAGMFKTGHTKVTYIFLTSTPAQIEGARKELEGRYYRIGPGSYQHKRNHMTCRIDIDFFNVPPDTFKSGGSEMTDIVLSTNPSIKISGRDLTEEHENLALWYFSKEPEKWVPGRKWERRDGNLRRL